MESLKSQYLDIISSGANLTTLCDFTSQQIGIPVALTLTTRTIIAKSKDYDKKLVEEYTSSLLLCSPEEIEEMAKELNEYLYKKKAVTKILPYLKYKRIMCGCFYKNRMMAVIDCPINTTMVHKDALKIIELAASIFTIALQLNSYIAPTITHPIQTYLVGLLRGDINEDFQQRNLYNSALETVSFWCIAWFQPESSNDFEKLQHHISKFCNQHEHIWFSDYETGFVVLLDYDQYETLLFLAETCCQFSRVSISTKYSNLNETLGKLRQAQFAIHLAEFEENESPLIFVQNYKMPMGYLVFFQEKKAEEIVSPTFEAIENYDKEHGTEYFVTLRAYLLNNMNTKKIAQKLHVHKNTVSYRLQRIEELFHVDLSDCKIITELYLSLFSVFLENKYL